MSDDQRTPMVSGGTVLDPLGDLDGQEGASGPRNRAKVGSSRPSTLLYTFGPGAVMDLPNFSVMPSGYDDWERIWARRQSAAPTIIEPRLLRSVQAILGSQVQEFRPFPWQPKSHGWSKEGEDLGVSARVFPQWMRCTGCDSLLPISNLGYTNTNPYRPDQAQFVHSNCPGRGKGPRGGKREGLTVPARHLLTCTNGHLDEFPYDLWVHRGDKCAKAAAPHLKMSDANVGKGTGSTIRCDSCGQTRSMSEALGSNADEKLPSKCRGRHPHMDAFDSDCDATPAVILMGASNLWFPATQSIIVMPRSDEEEREVLSIRLRNLVGTERLGKYRANLEVLRDVAGGHVEVQRYSDDELRTAVDEALKPLPTEAQRAENEKKWDPVDLLVPEWSYLQKPVLFKGQTDSGGLTVSEAQRSGDLTPGISRVIAVERMKKVNAFLGFTRLDASDRVSDVTSRLVPMVKSRKPKWVHATEDRGEGVFIQLDLEAVTSWEAEVEQSALWESHRASHERSFRNRFSKTADHEINPDERLPPPRYWLVHSLAHALIREMAMYCGYGSASLSERLYAWKEQPGRPGAAGVLICTTASDSEGTLGGLVALSAADRLKDVVHAALRRAGRCSSDPICAMRVPQAPEDFLHGAACHCCSFASETSCERSNRFLDRRFMVTLPASNGVSVPGFFGDAHEL